TGRRADRSASPASPRLRAPSCAEASQWGESSGGLLVLRRYVGAKAAVKENRGSAGGGDDQNVRMVGTGPGPSGHSSGTVGGREDTRTTQKCPSRLARPARLERATLRFEA